MKSGRKLKKYGGDVETTGLENKEALPDYFQVIADYITKL